MCDFDGTDLYRRWYRASRLFCNSRDDVTGSLDSALRLFRLHAIKETEEKCQFRK